MRPVQTEEELRQLRSTERQQSLVAQARQGQQDAKRKLLQFNYSCLPNEDGSLKASTRLSGSVGMDIDFSEADCQAENHSHAIRDRILSMKDELGLLFFERSATKGYHIAFKRHPELSQENNLRWASQMLGVKYDEGAKDHTRVFFSSTASDDDLLFVSPELFDNVSVFSDSVSSIANANSNANANYPQDYDGIPYSLLVECLADQLGGVPVHGSRNNFLFSMACHLRYVCNDDPRWIRQVLPTYGEDSERLYRMPLLR